MTDIKHKLASRKLWLAVEKGMAFHLALIVTAAAYTIFLVKTLPERSHTARTGGGRDQA